jgi:hypothetical protein
MLQVQSELSVKDIDLLFDSIDQNGDGSISFLEFTAAMIDPRQVDIREMNQVCSSLFRSLIAFLTLVPLFFFLDFVNTSYFLFPTRHSVYSIKSKRVI